MLYTGAAIEIQVLFDLRFFATWRRFVNRKLDATTAILHDLRHEGGVLCADSAIIEVNQLGKAEYSLEESDPLVHLAQFNVAHDMVNGGHACSSSPARNIRIKGAVPW